MSNANEEAITAPTDPVVALWAQAQTLEKESNNADDRHSALRAALIAQRGEIPDGSSAAAWWGDLPEFAQMDEMRVLANDLDEKISDLYRLIAKTPATTLEGISAKAAAALSNLVGDGWLSNELGYFDLLVNTLKETVAFDPGTARLSSSSHHSDA